MLADTGSYEVVFTYNRGSDRAKAICEKWREQRVKCFQLNLSDTASITPAMEQAIERFGPFDVVVHSAGITSDTAFYFMEPQQWHDVLTVSLNSFFYVNKACLKHMVQSRWGRIVSLVSVSGEAGNRGQVNYSAAKGAVIAASKSLAKEMASRNITVNCVSPGVIESDMTKDLPKEQVLKVIPANRYGAPSEVAAAIRFLVSEEAAYINGEVLRVNGGMYS
jgi:3-oxoacyl-[acyl-carrier protein] reductase